MKIDDTFHLKSFPKRYGIEGPAYVVFVKDTPIPTQFNVGDILKQGEHRWEIRAIERVHRGCFGGCQDALFGLVVDSIHGSPPCPAKGDVELVQ